MALLLGAAMPFAGAALAQTAPSWLVVVNNAVVAPQSVAQAQSAKFFSYNQPAINDVGQVVFRARAKPASGSSGSGSGSGGGGGSQPTKGVYTRDIAHLNGPVTIVADSLGMLVPAPNTTGSSFIEFPSTPRSDARSSMVATRAQHQGVVTLADGSKVGTSGVYATPAGVLTTAASQLGDVPGYAYAQVPGAAPGIGFDQFPGSPSPVANRAVVFKGNYTEGGVSKTGIFYRDALANGGTAPFGLVAHTGTPIPGTSLTFGSTAPPSAALVGAETILNNVQVVFTGFDVEDAPTAGGIYLSKLSNPTALRTIVQIGGAVPGAPGQVFNGFGEGLSFNGRYVSFWGSWGSAKMTVHKTCPTDGNADLIAFCLTQYPNGVDLTESVHQGIFFADTVNGRVRMAAQTGANGYTDFIYWVYSGMPPGTGGATDAEYPRWRASAFSGVQNAAMVFKGQKGSVDGLYVDVTYVADADTTRLRTLLDTTTSGQSVDLAAPAGSLVSSIGVERDGLRNGWLAVSVGMENVATAESWSGIYARYCGPACKQ